MIGDLMAAGDARYPMRGRSLRSDFNGQEPTAVLHEGANTARRDNVSCRRPRIPHSAEPPKSVPALDRPSAPCIAMWSVRHAAEGGNPREDGLRDLSHVPVLPSASM